MKNRWLRSRSSNFQENLSQRKNDRTWNWHVLFYWDCCLLSSLGLLQYLSIKNARLWKILSRPFFLEFRSTHFHISMRSFFASHLRQLRFRQMAHSPGQAAASTCMPSQGSDIMSCLAKVSEKLRKLVFAAKRNSPTMWVFPKIVGFPPKWMVYNGKPY